MPKTIHSSTLFLVNINDPKIALSPDEAERIEKLLLMIRDHIRRPNTFATDVLNMLLSIFLLNLHDSLKWSESTQRVTKRDEEVFIQFYTLLRQNFVEQHNIGFYADHLNMTTTHLSRIVKSLTGRTVMSFIDQMLMMEATWLLLSTNLTISQIADKLHFASAPSFDRFFTRIKGMSPKQVRDKNIL